MKNLEKALHLGVVGNFAVDTFSHQNVIGSIGQQAPTGLIATYVPFKDETNSILNTFPLSYSKIHIPTIYDKLQIEPEIVLDCEIRYAYNNNIREIIPKRFTAYNDVSIHHFSTSSITENKNWGMNSKGIASKWIDIDNFKEGGVLSKYNIVSFIKRDGVVEQYSIDTPIESYGYLYQNLLDWIMNEINRDKEYLNSIAGLLERAGYPDRFLINLGTTLYTEIGKRTFLEDRDEVFILLYDNTIYSSDRIKAYLLAYKTRKVNYEGMVVLHQTAYLT